MTTSLSAPPARALRGGRTARRERPRPIPRTTSGEAQQLRTLDFEAIASRWQRALDAAHRALAAAGVSLPAAEVERRRGALARERQQTAEALGSAALVAGVHPPPWLSPVPVTTEMLGLPSNVEACLFDLDGVLTDSGALHVWAWGLVFDDFLLRLGEKTGWHFIPFDRDADYRSYVEGRARIEAVHAFLGSRGIRVPEGSPGDLASADTARGLARRKGETVAQALGARRVTALAGARAYLEACGRAGVRRSVISASASTLRMLEHARLANLLDDRIDADVIRLEGLRSPPAMDVPRAACRRLGVRPDEAAAFTHSPFGAAAAQAAGLLVIGVADETLQEALLYDGADRVVPTLSALLDHRLAAASALSAT
jgi:beta-phosphoglucomutase-like phosphatase (HAD superfamily)